MSLEVVHDASTKARLEMLETAIARLSDKLAALESMVGGGVAEALAPRPDSHASRIGRLEARGGLTERAGPERLGSASSSK